MKKLFTLSVTVMLAFSVVAQDPNFSQFFASPLTLNPALTGKFDGDFRVAGNYRNQWPAFNNAYTTSTLSLDFGILKNSIPETDQFGIGIMAFTDKSGNQGALQNNYAAVSVAYHKGLDENGYHQLGVGFQGVYSSKRLDVLKLTFEDQLTPFGFTGSTGETFSGNQVNVAYFDMNAGIFYNGTTDGYNNIYLGASMYHINKPKESFQGKEYFLGSRVTFQGGGRIPVGVNNSIHFAANHSMQQKATNTMIGGAYALNLNGDEESPTNVYMGSWYRLGDAIIPYVGLEFNSFRIGATYDVNISDLRPGSQSRGGTEISIIYTKKASDPSRKIMYCPKF